ncbi:MAG: hypothetical protein JNL19_00185 [Burkholderiales bacterium]|nr:hypothetical protein [Burkholderiales bacterium]
MNTKDTKRSPDGIFLESYIAELVAMKDVDVLDGDPPGLNKEKGLAIVAAAKATVAKRRLDRARAAMDREKSITPASGKKFSPMEARAFLRSAANDSRFTLAARNHADMSDEDVMSLCEDIQRLMADKTDSGDAT